MRTHGRDEEVNQPDLQANLNCNQDLCPIIDDCHHECEEAEREHRWRYNKEHSPLGASRGN
jgi:hypothetical protein